MKNVLATSSVALGLALSLGSASTGFAKEYLVKLSSQKTFKANQILMKENKSDQFQLLDSYAPGQLLKIKVKESGDLASDQKMLTDLVSKHLKKSDIEYMVENIKFKTMETPDDPRFSSQWALEKVQAENAWKVSKGSNNVVVAVIDTGIDTKHEDLMENIWVNSNEIPDNGIDDDNNGFIDDVMGWDFFSNDNDPDDETSSANPGHGTHCAGIVGAATDNGNGIAGMAQTLKLMPIRFLGKDGSGDLLSATKAIDYAIDNGATIISASWGAPTTREQAKPVLEAIQRAEAAGIPFVAAAANEGRNNDSREVYPANAGFSNTISVAASNSGDSKPRWSNFGKRNVDLAAPGDSILSTLPNSRYGKLSGTSMATPLVAGLLALMYAQAEESGIEMTPTRALALLQSNGDGVSIETACDCRVNAGKTLTAIAQESLILVPATETIKVGEKLQVEGFGGQGPYKFATNDEAVLTVDESGMIEAVATGTGSIQLTDAAGTNVTSLPFNIVDGSTSENQCPYTGPLCNIACVINPSLPWCSK